MNINRIVYFVLAPFSDRDYERFGIEIVLKNGYQVEVWDFSPFLGFERTIYPIGLNRKNFQGYRVFLNMKDVICQIRTLRNDCLVVLIPANYTYESYPIYRALSKNKVSYAFVCYNFPSYDMNMSNNLRRKIYTISFEKILNILIYKFIPCWVIGIHPAKIFINLGSKIDFTKSRVPISKETDIVFSHHFDYDIYLKELQKTTLSDKNTCVFLDTFLPFHPDFGITPVIHPDEYYSRLCGFFDFLEKEYHVKIIIAAHPRSDYETRQDYFGGRKIIKGKTAELVRNSGLVICHESVSVNFAVLFEKPVIFATFKGLSGTFTGVLVNFMAGLLDKTPINLNDNFKIDWDKEMIVNKEAYRSYRNKYIKEEGTEELPIWQTFVNHLKNAGNVPNLMV